MLGSLREVKLHLDRIAQSNWSSNAMWTKCNERCCNNKESYINFDEIVVVYLENDLHKETLVDNEISPLKIICL